MLKYLILCRTINAEQHGKRINNMKGFNIDSAHTVILGTYPGQKSYKTKRARECCDFVIVSRSLERNLCISMF